MTRFFLVRHGETEWNRLRKIQGISDIPLNDTGRSQAAALGDILSKHRFDLICLQSPIPRSRDSSDCRQETGNACPAGDPGPRRAELR
jgi:uncharacterized phosphatase